MLRRNVGATSSGVAGVNASNSGAPSPAVGSPPVVTATALTSSSSLSTRRRTAVVGLPLSSLHQQHQQQRDPALNSGTATLVVVCLAVLILVATYILPVDVVQKIEHNAAVEAHHAYQQAEQAWEREMRGWFTHPDRTDGTEDHKVPVPIQDHPHFAHDGNHRDDDQPAGNRNEATERMLQHESRWVDGEKKLKAQLRILEERQKRGLDIGVPVLTRYLGEDIPAWAGPDVNVEEWRAKVQTKYDEMRAEELEWRKQMGAIIAQEKRG